MTNLFSAIVRGGDGSPQRSALAFNDWADFFKYGGLQYPFRLSMAPQTPEEVTKDFSGYVQGLYRENGVVYACVAARVLLFSEARFQYRQIRNGRPGDLFGTQDLSILERPWRNGTTGDLLTRAMQDTDLAGNFFAVRNGNSLMRLRPDWTVVITGSRTSDDPNAHDVEVVGYQYHAGGIGNGDVTSFMPEQVAHWAPTPDPAMRFLGMSWLTPVLNEILADKAATSHKLQFFNNGATPNFAVTFGDDVNYDTAERFITKFRQDNEGVENAYRTLFMGAGATITPVGADMKQIDFKTTQGAGETRIAAAAGVPPVLVGLSEGLASATYSNYGMARRRFADGTMRPLWRSFCASIANVITVPGGAELWYDDRDISFLQEDRRDDAEIQQTLANTRRTLIEAGYEPGSVNDAVLSNDYSRLKHTGMTSVQLQPPGSTDDDGEAGGATALPKPEPSDDSGGASEQIPAQTGQAAALASGLSRTP